VKRPRLLLATLAAALALTGSASAAGNPWGVSVVRFAHGTTPAQMRSAVTASGGVVVGDLSAIDALAVVPRSVGFDASLSSKRSVTGLFADTLIGTDNREGLREGGRDSGPGDGLAGDFPDPWHALFQWDDERMNVQPAWLRTTGDHSIAVAVIDTGVDADHRELRGVVDKKLGGNFIPCDDLKALFARACATAATGTSRATAPGSQAGSPARSTASPRTASRPASGSAPTRCWRPASAGFRAGSSPPSWPPAPTRASTS
jgi:hypothetical protein